jgi:hypothetical protein
MHGLHGQEINFYTGEDIKEDIYLGFHPETQRGVLPNKLASEIGPGLGMNLIMGFVASLYTTHKQLKEIYNIFECYKYPNTTLTDSEIKDNNDHFSQGDILFSINTAPQYQVEIHKLFYMLNKLCYNAILIKADKIVPRDGEMPLSIKSLFDVNYLNKYKEKIIEKVFTRSESIEVFKIIEDINNIFHSYHMYTLLNMMGTNIPTVCAFGPPINPNYAFLQHNHALWQIIKAVNTALKDINLL